jgi:hypothetical protein
LLLLLVKVTTNQVQGNEHPSIVRVAGKEHLLGGVKSKWYGRFDGSILSSQRQLAPFIAKSGTEQGFVRISWNSDAPFAVGVGRQILGVFDCDGCHPAFDKRVFFFHLRCHFASCWLLSHFPGWRFFKRSRFLTQIKMLSSVSLLSASDLPPASQEKQMIIIAMTRFGGLSA